MYHKTCTRHYFAPCVLLVYHHKYADFMPNFVHFTAWYCPKPFISSAIKNKSWKGVLLLLSYNVCEYRPLQAYFNIKMPVWLIFEVFVYAHFGVTRCRMVIISPITAHNCVVPTNAHTIHMCMRSFSRGYNHRVSRLCK